jgi:hypothetical protein
MSTPETESADRLSALELASKSHDLLDEGDWAEAMTTMIECGKIPVADTHAGYLINLAHARVDLACAEVEINMNASYDQAETLRYSARDHLRAAVTNAEGMEEPRIVDSLKARIKDLDATLPSED